MAPAHPPVGQPGPLPGPARPGDRLRTAAGGILSALFGLAYLLALAPTGFVAGTSSYWQNDFHDIAQYLAGYTAYLREPWGLPLLRIESLNWPDGTLVTYMDAIPLLAFALKLVAPLAPANPFGYWIALCFALQGFAAWWAIRQAGVRSVPVLCLGVVLAVTMPALSLRIGHTSLMAHFLIWLAFGLYLRNGSARQSFLLWSGLILASFYINLYQTAMVLTLLIAAAVDGWLRGRPLIWVASVVAAVLPLLASLPLTMGTHLFGQTPEGGFGIYSMNLLAPFTGGRLVSLPFYRQGTEGQYEGWNTLGLGLMLACLAMVLRRGAAVGHWRRTRPALFTALILFFVYALSDKVYLSDIPLLEYRMPTLLEPLTTAFRVSGRFFWPVGYALILGVCVLLGQSRRPGVQVALLCLALAALQTADLRDIRRGFSALTARQAHQVAGTEDILRAFGGAGVIYHFPKWRCATGDHLGSVAALKIATTVPAALRGGYIARVPTDCGTMATEIAAADPATSVFMFLAVDFPAQEAQRLAGPGMPCQPFGRWHVCRAPR